MGRGQGVPTFKESACCSDQPVQGAAWDTGGSHDCSSDKPEGASPGPMKLKAWRPDVEPACLGHGAGVPHAKLLAQTWCVCRMAAPRQEEKESTFPAERIGDMVGLLAELLQCEGLVLSELENPCSQGGLRRNLEGGNEWQVGGSFKREGTYVCCCC